ncbi:phosphoribosyl 1,2-cyclic phosphodiesterase [Pedobacter sp. UYP30]|uniref:MBL fold metallo-hydrolase n=1 Tax=Pedobacter sp. UYP30 TaxID=1756400 RepID=UPI0033956D30
MGLYFSSLNSGSNGNCYYVGNGNEAILVDVGISCKEIEKRMARQGLDLGTLKAIFISHEHSDHIKGLEVFAKKHKLPVYISKKTLQHSKLSLHGVDVCFLDGKHQFRIGKLQISAFSKIHDAADPYSFVVEHKNFKVGVFTDLGKVCSNLIAHFKECNAVFLEANYDTEMLQNGNYPFFLKQRIMGGRGHLSNVEALELYCQHRPKFMSHVLLCHLSQQNNDPNFVRALFCKISNVVMVEIASRTVETPVYFVGDLPKQESAKHIQPEQLQLF